MSDGVSSQLARVNIPQPDVHQVPGGEERLHPGEPWDIWHLRWMVLKRGCEYCGRGKRLEFTVG